MGHSHFNAYIVLISNKIEMKRNDFFSRLFPGNYLSETLQMEHEIITNADIFEIIVVSNINSKWK